MPPVSKRRAPLDLVKPMQYQKQPIGKAKRLSVLGRKRRSRPSRAAWPLWPIAQWSPAAPSASPHGCGPRRPARRRCSSWNQKVSRTTS